MHLDFSSHTIYKAVEEALIGSYFLSLDEPLFENLVVNLLVPLLTGVAGKTDTTEQE